MSAYTRAVIADAPVGYWRLNESSGTVAADLSGNANNGTYFGTYTLGATSPITGDPTSKALDLTGTQETVNGYVTISDSTALNMSSSSAFTAECWVKSIAPSSTNTNPYAGLIFKQPNAGGGGYGINHDSNGQFPVGNVVTSNNTGGVASTFGIANDNTNAWMLIHCVYTGSGIQIYENATALGSPVAATGTIVSSSGNALCIGNIFASTSPYPYQWEGYICEVAIYNFALSSTRISAHYAAATQTQNPQTDLFASQAIMRAATR
jgi:hypothetical protein